MGVILCQTIVRRTNTPVSTLLPTPMFGLLQYLDLLLVEGCSDSMAMDAWVLVPFFLGYISWRILFVGFELPSQYDRLAKKCVHDPADFKCSKNPSPAEVADTLAQLRKELLADKERTAATQAVQ